jgi:hypothetical protein
MFVHTLLILPEVLHLLVELTHHILRQKVLFSQNYKKDKFNLCGTLLTNNEALKRGLGYSPTVCRQ